MNDTATQTNVIGSPLAATRQRWRMQFSLRTLLVFVMLIGSAGGLWWRWEPWATRWSAPVSSKYFAAKEFSPNGSLLLATDTVDLSDNGDYRNSIHLFDANTGNEMWSYTDPTHRGIIYRGKTSGAIAWAESVLSECIGTFDPTFSPDGKWLSVCIHTAKSDGFDERLLFRSTNGERANIANGMWKSRYASFSPDGKWFLTEIDRNVCAIELSSLQKRILINEAEHRGIRSAYWVDNGRSIITTRDVDDDGSAQCQASVWDFQSGALKKTYPIGGEGCINAAFVVARNTVVAGFQSFQDVDADKMLVIDLDAGEITREVFGRLCFASSPGEKMLLGATRFSRSRLRPRASMHVLEVDGAGTIRELGCLKDEASSPSDRSFTTDGFVCVDIRQEPRKWIDLRTGRIDSRPGYRSLDSSRFTALQGKRLKILDSNAKEIFRQELPADDNETNAMQPFFSGNDRILTQYGHSWMGVWDRRRPEYWWGIAWLPDFWLTLLFAGALIWSARRDGRQLRGLTPA